MATVRSHDQYNTTIYGNDDRYRGIYGARREAFLARFLKREIARRASTAHLLRRDGGLDLRGLE